MDRCYVRAVGLCRFARPVAHPPPRCLCGPCCSHIRWWRIVVDEPQLQAGGFLVDKEHIWMSQHRWLLTGTPINATGAAHVPAAPPLPSCIPPPPALPRRLTLPHHPPPPHLCCCAVETLGPSTEFLKLGAWDALYRYYPPVIAHVLKVGGRAAPLPLLEAADPAPLPTIPSPLPTNPPLRPPLQRAMVRFTKRGELDGEPNLVLPPLAENTVEVHEACLGAPSSLHTAPEAARSRHAHLPGHPALPPGTASFPARHAHVSLPLPAQCELTEEDRVRYQQLRRDKRYEFREVLSKIRINPETLGGEPRCNPRCAAPLHNTCTRRGLPFSAAQPTPTRPAALPPYRTPRERSRLGGAPPQAGRQNDEAARHGHRAAPGRLQ